MGILDSAKDMAKNIGGEIIDSAKDLAKNIGGEIIDEVGNKIKGSLAIKNDAGVTTGEADSESKKTAKAEKKDSNVSNMQVVSINSIDKVTTIPELTAFLGELKNRQDNESALAYAINAQLQVLTVLNNPEMTSSPFDLMLESLKTAVQKSKSEYEKTQIQQKAAVMTNSMVFFMKAKMYYEKDKWEKEGVDLLKQACEMAADSALSLTSMAVTGGVAAPAVAQKLGISLLNSIMENRGGFLKRIIDWWSKEERLAQYKLEFYRFLESSFEKLLRYKNLFGSSTILRNLVLNHKENLIYQAGDKSRELRKLDSENPVLTDKTGGIRFFFCSVGVFFILLTITLGFSYLFYLFNLWGGDKWVEALANSKIFDGIFSIHFGILEYPLFIKIVIAAAGWLPAFFSGRAVRPLGFYQIESVKTKRINKIADEYYTLLAEKLDEY